MVLAYSAEKSDVFQVDRHDRYYEPGRKRLRSGLNIEYAHVN